MPQIPIYQTQVREQALEGGFQKAPDVGSDVVRAGQGISQIGSAMMYGVERDAQAKAADIESKITTEWLKWDASPEGRAKYRGQNADGYAAAAEAWWKTASETYGKDLDPRSRALASKSLTVKQNTALGNALQFQAAEKERHADETYAADVATTIQFGVTSGNVASTAMQIREKAAALGARKNWTTEQVQAEAQKNLSGMHLAQITKLATLDPAKAQEYYTANKAEVAFAQQARVEEVIKAELDNQFATQTAAKMADKPLSDQLAEAAKITDPVRREKTLNQVRNNYALVKQAEREQEDNAADRAWQDFSQGKKTPEAILKQMSGRERAQLVEAQRMRAQRLSAGTVKPVKTNWDTYLNLRERLANGEKLNLQSYTEVIAPSQLEQLADIQFKTKSDKKAAEVATTEQQLRTYSAKFQNPKVQAQFTAAAQDLFNEKLKRTGKEPDFDERQKILDGLVKDVVINKRTLWLDETGPAFMLPREQVREQVLGKTPAQTPQQAPAKATTPAQAPKRVKSVAEANALAPGTRFIDPQGVERIR